MASAARVEGLEKSARALCTFALIAIFLTGFVGYFAVNRITAPWIATIDGGTFVIALDRRMMSGLF